MCVVPKSGYYFRMRCATCGKYVVTLRRRTRTCSTLCRQRRKRGEDRSRPEFVETLGYLRTGARISGKLAEKLQGRATST